jgi:multidrug efflux pump subunit AcrA (membrane-fusion protein)
MKVLSLLAASMAVTHAAELTVEAKPFRIDRTFSATLLPAKPLMIAIEPDAWIDFVIEEMVPHGKTVKKGDVVVKFDREAYDRKLEDLRRAVQSRALSLASQELAFVKLEEETTLKLEAARRAASQAAEELEYFTKVGRQTDEEEIADNLEGAKRRLEATREELKQLKMMYDADDLTEQTEEIILRRQEYAVQSSELSLKHTELATKRALEVTLPRRAIALETEAKGSAIELEKAEKNLPRGLEGARLDLESARTAAAREKDELAKIEKDAALFEIKAAADGAFYHGSLDEGRWSLGELAKSLVKGGRAPFIRPFASIVPTEADLGLVAHVDESVARSLKAQLKGNLTAAGREDVALTATIQEVAGVPAGDGKYRVDLLPEWPEKDKLEWPADLDVAAGMSFECRFVVYQEENAIAVPAKALQAGEGGTWTLQVKMADGKSETRPVARGRAHGELVEIVSGLEGGQVVIIPD